MVDLANKDPFNLPPNWRAVTDRICSMMMTGNAPTELNTGPASKLGIERYARAICDANPQSDLGIMYGLVSVGACIAAQGAWVVQVPISGGGYLTAPAIEYFIGIAPSGWRKSTALNVAREPLRKALAVGEDMRRRQLPLLRKDSLAQADLQGLRKVGDTVQHKQFAQVFNGGLCGLTLVKDPTVEGLRNMLVKQGGVAGVMAGEADVFRNVSLYAANGDAGSLTFFLDGWSQDDVSTMRVGQGMLTMEEAALVMGVLFQTDVFAEVTSGSMRGGSSGGADSYQQRGVFGRFWVVEAASTGGWVEAANAYSDDLEWDDNHGPDGVRNAYGQKSLLGLALDDYTTELVKLVEESNDYRMSKALRHAWLIAKAEHGTDLQVPEVYAEPRFIIELDRDARVVYSRIQRMYGSLEHFLEDADPDAIALWGPLVARFVSHVLREALVVSLAAGRRYITAEILEDCALRIVPWRWALSTRALLKRNTDRAEQVLSESFMANPHQVDLSVEAKVQATLGRMVSENQRQAKAGWTQGEIVQRTTSTLHKDRRKGVAPTLRAALQKLVDDPTSKVKTVKDGFDRDGHQRYRYTMDPADVTVR